MPIYLPSGGALTQAAILAAFVDDIEFGVRAGFGGNIDGSIVSATGAAGSFQFSARVYGSDVHGSLYASGTGDGYVGLEAYGNAGSTSYVELFLTGKTIDFYTASDGSLVALSLGENGAATCPQGLILPSSDPLIAGAWWDNAGTLTKSTGP